MRVQSALHAEACARLLGGAPDEWVAEPEQIGNVKQRGLRTGLVFDACPNDVQRLGLDIVAWLDRGLPTGIAPLPVFNTVTWGKTLDGRSFITRHRDPPTASGVIATITLRGRATFRIFHNDEATEWETNDGDLVVIRGTGWPTAASTCPLHEAESIDTERFTLTFRHNTRGPGADYFN